MVPQESREKLKMACVPSTWTGVQLGSSKVVRLGSMSREADARSTIKITLSSGRHTAGGGHAPVKTTRFTFSHLADALIQRQTG